MAESSPDMRPALIGRDSKSLINAIDTAELMKKGQTDATVRFACYVGDGGRCSGLVTFGGTANSDALANEVRRRSEVEWPLFVPARYHGQTRPAYVCGTVVFFIKENKPHLRIYLNQETEHVARGDDFVAPQVIYLKGQTFRGFTWPAGGVGSSGLVLVRLNVDAAGKVTGVTLAMEKPEGRGFGAEVMGRIGEVVFIPGYLHGQPVSCTSTLPVLFKSGFGGRWKPG